MLSLVTTDFLATGGDGFFAETSLPFQIGTPIRDEMAEVLRARKGTLAPDDPTLSDPRNPRFALPGPVPIRCSE